MKVCIICDLSETSGFGHFNRMKVLNNELKKNNLQCCFVFPDKYKYFIEQQDTNIEIDYFNFLDNSIEKDYLNFIIKLKPEIVIIDSYLHDSNLESLLRKNGFFVVSIDDHLKVRNADIVFSNRSDISYSFLNKNDNWYVGPSFCLVNKIKSSSVSGKVQKILLHAGGTSCFNLISKLVISTLKISKKYNLKLDILCTTENSKIYIEKLIKKNGFENIFNIIPFIINFRETLNIYDVIVGPSGTITFEAIMAKCVPLSVPLKNDGRDSESSWPYLGHMMHLNYKESQSEKILNASWEVLLKNYKKLKDIINYSEKLDGKGPKRVVEKILQKYKNKNNVSKTQQAPTSIKKYHSHRCTYGNARYFLNSRNNKFVRQMSSNPNHIITWPEHVQWWLKSNSHKFSLLFNNEIVAFHWFKPIKDNLGNFIVSGWFPVAETPDNLRISNLILKNQLKEVKSTFKNKIWIIAMNKNNKFVHMINKNVGFIKASSSSIKRAENYFLIERDKFIFMEMKL